MSSVILGFLLKLEDDPQQCKKSGMLLWPRGDQALGDYEIPKMGHLSTSYEIYRNEIYDTSDTTIFSRAQLGTLNSDSPRMGHLIES